MIDWNIFLLLIIAYVSGVIVGVFVMWVMNKKETGEEPRLSEFLYNPEWAKKPGGIFKTDIPSGIIKRPSAKQLAKWNEPVEKKAVNDALRETFAADKELAELKRLREEYAKSTQR